MMNMTIGVAKGADSIFDTSLFFNLSTDIFCIAGTDGYFRKVNPALLNLLGYTEEELLDKPFVEFVHPDDRISTRQEAFHVSNGYATTFFENRYRKKTGGYCWLSWSATLLSKEGLIYAVAKDITEKKKYEQKLKEANERYELITEATAAGVWEWDLSSGNVYWHGDNLKNLLGFSELSYNVWLQSVHPDDQIELNQLIEQAIKGRDEYFVCEYRWKTKTGGYKYVKERCQIIRNANAEAIKVIGVTDDITAERQAKEALIRSEREYKSLFDNAPLPNFIYDLKTLRFLEVNEAAVQHYGYTVEEFLQMTVFDIRPKEEHEKMKQVFEAVRNTNKPLRFSGYYHLKKNGEIISVELTSTKVYYKGYNAGLVTVSDVTERIKLQEKLTELKVLEQKKIAQATFAALEKERSFIGKELHDNVNQILTSAKLLLEMAKVKGDMCISLIDKSANNITDAIQEIRLLSKSLTSPIIKGVELSDAIDELLYPYQLVNKFEIHFTHQGGINNIDHDIQFTIFRIVQEQLNNINKHAQAKNVWLCIIASEDGVKATIKDDGKGFDVSANYEGIGLRNIRSRVEFLNGKVDIISQPGHGCTLGICIPQ